MTSNCAGAVQSAFRLNVGGMGFFGSAEVTKIPHDAVCLNDGSPLPMIPVSAKKSGARSLLRDPLILGVVSLGDVAKVAKPVVGTNSVDVVNVVARELPMHIEPRKSVKRVCLAGDLRPPISISVNVPNRGVNRDAVAGFNPPRKHTSLGVVMKNFTQACCGKIGLSHDAVLSLIGQMPGGIPLPAGHRHFTTGVA